MSAATLLETAIVVEARLGDPGGREFDLWLHRAEVEMIPGGRGAGRQGALRLASLWPG